MVVSQLNPPMKSFLWQNNMFLELENGEYLHVE